MILLIPSIQGYSSGINGQVVDSGCMCHGGGAISESSAATIEGVPTNWTAGETYTIYVNLSGPETEGVNSGGFNLRSSTGTFSALDEMVQIVEGEATHTSAGNDLREWTLEWTAPSNSNKNVVFNLFANAVNGDGSADSQDHWTSTTSLIVGKEQPINDTNFDDFTSSEIMTIVIAIGIAIIFILTTEAMRIEIFKE